MSAVVGFTVAVSPDGDLDSSRRRLSAQVCPSPMHLAEVAVQGSVVDCTFRLRHHSAVLDDGTLHDVLRRLASYETSDVRLVTVTSAPTEMLPDVDTAA